MGLSGLSGLRGLSGLIPKQNGGAPEPPPSQATGNIIYVNNRHDYGSGSAIPVIPINAAKTTFDVAFAGGQAFTTGPLGSDMGVYVPYRSQFDQITGPNVTFFIYCAVTGTQHNAAAMSFPASPSNWANPFFDLALSEYKSTLEARFRRNINGSLEDSNAAGQFWFEDGSIHSYSCTHSASDVVFYLDGQVFHVNTGSNFTLPTLNDFAIFNRSKGSPGEAMSGTVLVAAVWNRALTATEIAELHADPLMLLP